MVAIGISGYFNDLLGFVGLELPLWMSGAPGTESEGVAPGSYVVNLFAVLLCLLIAFVLNQGMRNAARFEVYLVFLTLLPAWIGRTNERTGAPSRITWLLGVASALIAGFLPIGEAAELTNIGILLAFVVVCIAVVVVLRYRQPDLPRSFRCPGMPFVPIVGAVFSQWLITFLAPETWLRFGLWFLVGAVVYFAYGMRRPVLARRRS